MEPIELPPLNASLNSQQRTLYEHYARAAILADRQKREKPGKVQKYHLELTSNAAWPRNAPVDHQHGVQHSVTLCWTADRVWIDSERNRELARFVRNWAKAFCPHGHKDWQTVEEAADALDGGNLS